MPNELTLYRGQDGDKILSMIAGGSIPPNEFHQVFFSQLLADALQHGGDQKRKATFAVKMKVTVPAGASITRTSTLGNPLAVVITTVHPLPVQVIEMYVRPPRGSEYLTIQGVPAIKAHLL